MKINIVSRWDSSVLFTAEAASILLALEAAIKSGANLWGADLRSANLWGANLRSANLGGADLGGADLRSANLWGADLGGANLRSANLWGANLWGANLGGADLWGANLGGADLRSANLWGADLGGANLRSANLRSANLWGANLGGADLWGANLGGADLPSPTTILLANWGTLSDSLTADLMEYDSSNHPERAAFDRWVEGGPCPYEGIRVQRAAHFTENKKVWGTGTLKSAYALMLKLFEESDIKF